LEDKDCHGGWKCKNATHTCVAPSCDGLASTCGKNAIEDCCTSLVVPEGTFNRDNNVMYPAHVSAFSLDKFEVTVGRFRKYVAQYTQAGTPAHGGTNLSDEESTGWDKTLDQYLPKDVGALKTQLAACDGGAGTWTNAVGINEDKPISCVSWWLAESFCIWDGGRLPTEAEWNYAAAGGDEQRVYPWSSPPDDTTISSAYAVYGTTAPLAVGSKWAHPARWGHADMAGNVTEWIADYNSAKYPVPCDNCEVHAVDPFHVFRGGGFAYTPETVTTTYRAYNNNNGRNVDGVRCARTP
jgi:formylglycine-generating enzyme required for sulfatase activity